MDRYKNQTENKLKLQHEFPEFFDNDTRWISFPDGWFGLFRQALLEVKQECLKKNLPIPKIQYTKEKFAEFRILFVGDWFYITSKYMSLSSKICEYCGKDGEIVTTDGGWYFTRCSEHSKVEE